MLIKGPSQGDPIMDALTGIPVDEAKNKHNDYKTNTFLKI